MMSINEYKNSLANFLDRCNIMPHYTVNAFVSDEKQVEEFTTKILEPTLNAKNYADIEVERSNNYTKVSFNNDSKFILDIADQRFSGNHTHVLMISSSVEDMTPFYGCIVDYVKDEDVSMLNPKPIFFDMRELYV